MANIVISVAAIGFSLGLAGLILLGSADIDKPNIDRSNLTAPPRPVKRPPLNLIALVCQLNPIRFFRQLNLIKFLCQLLGLACLGAAIMFLFTNPIAIPGWVTGDIPITAIFPPPDEFGNSTARGSLILSLGSVVMAIFFFRMVEHFIRTNR